MKKKSFFSSLLDFLWLLILIAVVYAFVKVNNIQTAEDCVEMVKLKSYELSACIRKYANIEGEQYCNLSLKVKMTAQDLKEYKHNTSNKSNNNNNDKPVSSKLNPPRKNNNDKKIDIQLKDVDFSSISKEEMLEYLDELEIKKPDYSIKYNRMDWKHWSNTQSSCWNTREEAMYNQAEKNTIELLDKYRNSTNNKKIACYISKGNWISLYDNKLLEKPSQVDVDHVYPLGRASVMGGASFDSKTKEKFANDMNNLLAVSARTNRSKGSKGPGEWMPENKSSWCIYGKSYTFVAKKYNLGITTEDKNALKKALLTCVN